MVVFFFSLSSSAFFYCSLRTRAATPEQEFTENANIVLLPASSFFFMLLSPGSFIRHFILELFYFDRETEDVEYSMLSEFEIPALGPDW